MTGTQVLPSWPDGARCAVMLSFDVDGPTLWVDKRDGSYDDIGGFLQGSYGPAYGLPRILNLLDQTEVPATFFVPARIAEYWPGALCEVVAAGHEIGNHGYLHERFFDLPSDRQELVLRRSQDIITERLGVTPAGFRSPSGEVGDQLAPLLLAQGLAYSSSMRGDDRPYFWETGGQPTRLVEICAHWELDDYQQFCYSRAPLQPPGGDRISSIRSTFDIWRTEFDGYYEFGLCYVLMMHPQVIGTPGRLAALRDLIAYMAAHEGVWFATGAQIAAHWRTRYGASEGGAQ